MSRYDLRYLRRHPLRWFGYWWPFLALALAFYVIAVMWTEPTFDLVRLDFLWPVGLASVATFLVATAIAPFNLWLRIITGAGMISLGVFRIAFYIDAITLISDRAIVAQLIVQIAHWSIIAIIGTALPNLIAETALRSTIEAGRDDRGSNG